MSTSTLLSINLQRGDLSCVLLKERLPRPDPIGSRNDNCTKKNKTV